VERWSLEPIQWSVVKMPPSRRTSRRVAPDRPVSARRLPRPARRLLADLVDHLLVVDSVDRLPVADLVRLLVDRLPVDLVDRLRAVDSVDLPADLRQVDSEGRQVVATINRRRAECRCISSPA
jgi:hypothetical protein